MDVFAFPVSEYLLKIAKTIHHHEHQVVIGRIASGDQFIDDKKHALSIQSEFKALACEMEGAAIAQVCYVNKVEFVVALYLTKVS